MRPTGIILAGGQSRRFGSNKALYCINEITMLEHAIKALQPFCDNLIISGEETTYNFTGIKCISDHYPSVGPLSGICSTIEDSPTDSNIILTCDMPFVSNELIKLLIQNHIKGNITMYHAGKDGFYPFPMIIEKEQAITIKNLIENKQYKVKDLLSKCTINYVDIPESLKSGMTNINYFIDLKKKL